MHESEQRWRYGSGALLKSICSHSSDTENPSTRRDFGERKTGRGPGFARLKAARAQGTLIDTQARVVDDLPSSDDVDCGMRVFHQKFGYGTIQAKDGNKLEIEFEKAGAKKVLDSFVVRA